MPSRPDVRSSELERIGPVVDVDVVVSMSLERDAENSLERR
jgi:hypothetical protein